MGTESLDRMVEAVSEGQCAIRYIEQRFGNDEGEFCYNCASCVGLELPVKDANKYKPSSLKHTVDTQLELSPMTTTTTTTTTPQRQQATAAAAAAYTPSQDFSTLRLGTGKQLDFGRTSMMKRSSSIFDKEESPTKRSFTASRDVFHDLYEEQKQQILSSGYEQCLLCSERIGTATHYPSSCSGLKRWLQGRVYCNYCFSDKHKRVGDNNQKDCCDYRKRNTCWCYRQECGGSDKTNPKLCDTYFTLRSVLVWFWIGNKTLLWENFPETQAFRSYTELFQWATTKLYQANVERPP